MYQLSLALFIRKAVVLLEATPATSHWQGLAIWSPLGEGSLGRGALIWDIASLSKTRAPLVRVERGQKYRRSSVCLGTMIPVVLMRKQLWRSYKTHSRP